MYHRTNVVDPIDITPRGFVRGLPEFAELAPPIEAGDHQLAAEIAVELTHRGLMKVEKVWTELAVEFVRDTHYPDSVSRFDCVFLFENAIDAFESLGTWGSSQWVWRCAVDDGIQITRCDVDHFIVRDLDSERSESWLQKWDQTVEEAHAYWTPGANPTAELLVAGRARLIERVHLRDFL